MTESKKYKIRVFGYGYEGGINSPSITFSCCL